MSVTTDDYIKEQHGVIWYDFNQIDSIKVCQSIERQCNSKKDLERIKAVAYLVCSTALSLLLGFSSLNFVGLQVLTIYFFSSDAWRKSSHYSDMGERAELRNAELSSNSRLFRRLPEAVDLRT